MMAVALPGHPTAVSNISAVAAGGLTLDIAGALLLASGLMFKPSERAIDEVSPNWGFNTALEANVASQSADAQIGAVLLVAGFAAQFASALGARGGSWDDAVSAVVLAAAVDGLAVVILLRVWRPWHIRRLLAARLAALDIGSWWPALAAYGEILGRPAPAGISVELSYAHYGEILLGKRWRALVRGVTLPDTMTKLRRDLAGTPEFEAASGEVTGAAS